MKLFGYDVDKIFKLVRDAFIITSSIETAMRQIDSATNTLEGKEVVNK